MMRRICFLFALTLLVVSSGACSSVPARVQNTPTVESLLQTPTKLAATTPRAVETRPTATRAVRVNGLQTITLSELPPEARETLALIKQGGPFPYRQDGQEFQNRERLLPRHPRGYYHEYTVKTPGESDRGARRIVTGKEGELYYTDDHYNSFKVILLNE